MTPDETVLDLSELDHAMPTSPDNCAQWMIRIASEKKRLNIQLENIRCREDKVVNEISKLDRAQHTLIKRFAAQTGIDI